MNRPARGQVPFPLRRMRLHEIMATFLIVSDVDGTILGDADGLTDWAQWMRDQRDQFRFVLASGRFFHSLKRSVLENDIPAPDAIIGGVGTEIRLYPSGTPMPGWQTLMAVDWEAERVRQSLASMPELTLQPEEFLSDWKVSYYAYDASPGLLDKVRSRLADARIGARVIYSSQRDLDVLPAAASKGSAVRYVAARWRVPAERVIVCGDSGNDASMFEHGFRGVIVGNADAELKSFAGPGVHVSQRSHAHGVLEGLQKWMEEYRQSRYS